MHHLTFGLWQNGLPDGGCVRACLTCPTAPLLRPHVSQPHEGYGYQQTSLDTVGEDLRSLPKQETTHC